MHPDIVGVSGMNTTKGMYQGKAITSIEASECVVTPINSARTVDFKVNANTCNECLGSIQVGPSTMKSVERKKLKGTTHRRSKCDRRSGSDSRRTGPRNAPVETFTDQRKS